MGWERVDQRREDPRSTVLADLLPSGVCCIPSFATCALAASYPPPTTHNHNLTSPPPPPPPPPPEKDVAPAGLHSVFERFRAILHEGAIDKRTQYIIEGLFAIRKVGVVGGLGGGFGCVCGVVGGLP